MLENQVLAACRATETARTGGRVRPYVIAAARDRHTAADFTGMTALVWNTVSASIEIVQLPAAAAQRAGRVEGDDMPIGQLLRRSTPVEDRVAACRAGRRRADPLVQHTGCCGRRHTIVPRPGRDAA
ncbi:hypothetical protein [Dactylosporangium sp. CA-139066]|uniref:hypothetical protein n=1 Tax=Dactylosporangium sp. CA-139066 TaxID=3239930 RepID=UPI003D8FA13C